MTTDAFITSLHLAGEGMVRAMRAALAQGGAHAVGYCNAHGTGTLQNDRIEALALRAVFGEGRPPGELDEVHRRSHMAAAEAR